MGDYFYDKKMMCDYNNEKLHNERFKYGRERKYVDRDIFLENNPRKEKMRHMHESKDNNYLQNYYRVKQQNIEGIKDREMVLGDLFKNSPGKTKVKDIMTFEEFLKLKGLR